MCDCTAKTKCKSRIVWRGKKVKSFSTVFRLILDIDISSPKNKISNTVKRCERKEGVQEFSDWRKNLRLGIFQPCLVQVLAWCNCFTKIPTSSAWEVYSLSGFLKYSFYSFTAIKSKRQWSAIEIEKEMWIRYKKRTVKNMWIARQLSRGRGINSGCRDLNAPLQSARALWN